MESVTVEIVDPNCRKYHTTARISNVYFTTIFTSLRHKERELEEIGEVGASLVREVMAVLGEKLKEVRISKDVLSVLTRKGANWGEIEPKVIEALKRAFGNRAQEVEVIYPEVSL